MWSSFLHYFNALTFIFLDRDLLSEVAGSRGPFRSAVVSLAPRRAVWQDIGQMAEINLKPGILVAGEGEMRALLHAWHDLLVEITSSPADVLPKV